MADQTEISDIIAQAWTGVDKSESGLSSSVTASDTMIRAMTDAVAAGILSALPVVPGGLPLKGWLHAASGRTVDASSGLEFERLNTSLGWGIAAPASLGAQVLVVFTSVSIRISSTATIPLPARAMATRSTPGKLVVLSSDLISGNTDFTACTQTAALAF